MYSIQYDIDRFGDSTVYIQKFNLLENIMVKRIEEITTVKKELATFTCYQPSKTIGTSYNWRNESRLYNYPYMYAYINDHLNPPMEIKYHLCPSNQAKLMVKNSISDRCSYGLYVDGYKGDTNGTMEAMISSDAHEIPVSSDAYGTWVANNKNQITQNIKNMQFTTMLQNQGISTNTMYSSSMNMVNTVGNVASGIGGFLEGDFDKLGTTGAGAINSMLATLQLTANAENQMALNNRNIQNAIQSAIATGNDMKSVPNTMISMGSDVYYGLINGDAQVYLYRMGLQEEMYERLGNYFAMYGYKQNKVMSLSNNIRSRYYYNYVKTIGCNMTGDIPRKYMNVLKSIFDKGVTLWHVDRTGVEVLNYTKNDNYEI